MNIDFDTLEQLADEVQGEAYPRYSGRGMYGRQCAGIVMDTSDLALLGAAITWHVESDELQDLLLRRVSVDSMGLRSIVYWTPVKCEDAPEDQEEEEEDE